MAGEVVVFGIRECDSCRKAIRWLSEQDIEHRFHDVRRQGITGADVERWLDAVGPEALINRRSRTWRQIDEVDRQKALDFPRQLLLSEPTLIKRPVFEHNGRVLVGFRPDELQRWLSE